MVGYRTLHVIRHHLADGRLADCKVFPDGVMLFEYRHGFIAPALVARLSAFSASVADAGVFDLDPGRVGGPPALGAWFDLTACQDTPMTHRIGFGLTPFFEIRCRADMVDAGVVREMNDLLPWACGALVPAKHPAE
ncbi:hypothetical protein [Streptomyces sp. NPDC055085]